MRSRVDSRSQAEARSLGADSQVVGSQAEDSQAADSQAADNQRADSQAADCLEVLDR